MSAKRKGLNIKEGTQIAGRYLVEEQIGEGGFATVYGAKDEIIDRPVAIKVLELGQIEDDDDKLDRVLQRFLREARTAARITHPSVVDIYDFGVLGDGDAPYIIMEYLVGVNLYAQINDDGPMSPQWLLPNFCDLLDALGEAHDHQIVHKDLKPSNVFLNQPQTRREVWKIVDFGIAHVDGPSSARLTKTGFLSGTPQYLSPEYIEEQVVSPAMDVYQMGLVLVEALCGEPVVKTRQPFKAVRKHVDGDLDIDDKIWDSPLGPVLRQALEIDSEKRFRTGHEFADALAGVDPQSVPSYAEPVRSEQKTAKWVAVDGRESRKTQQFHRDPTKSK